MLTEAQPLCSISQSLKRKAHEAYWVQAFINITSLAAPGRVAVVGKDAG